MRARSAFCFALLFVLPPGLKGLALRLLCRAEVGRKVSIGWFASVRAGRISLGDYAVIRGLTVIACNGDLVLGKHSQVSSFTLVYGSASFVVGDHSYVGPQSLINADEDVRLGRHTALGARAVVYTHGSWLPYTEGYWARFGAVTLGDHVWCAACVFLHPGVTIGDRVFINSQSVVTSDIPGESVAEGNPARIVAQMKQLRRRMTPDRLDAAIAEMLDYFVEVELRRVRGLAPARDSPDSWRVQAAADAQRLVIVKSRSTSQPSQRAARGRDICLLNLAGFAAHPGPRLDFTTMRFDSRDDELCEALVEFLKRYYGVQFERHAAGD